MKVCGFKADKLEPNGDLARYHPFIYKGELWDIFFGVNIIFL